MLFTHTMMVLDKVASATSDKITIFCALMHDIGKEKHQRNAS